MKLRILRPVALLNNQSDTKFRDTYSGNLLFNVMKLEWRINTLIKHCSSLKTKKLIKCNKESVAIKNKMQNMKTNIISIFNLLPYDSPINYSLNMLARKRFIETGNQSEFEINGNKVVTNYVKYPKKMVDKFNLTIDVPLSTYEFFRNELEMIDTFIAEIKQVNEAMYALQDWLNGCAKEKAKKTKERVPQNIASEVFVINLRDYLAHRDEINSRDEIKNLNNLEKFLADNKIMHDVKYVESADGFEYPYMVALSLQFIDFTSLWIEDINKNYSTLGFKISVHLIDYKAGNY